MLQHTLISINQILDNLIEITKQDIEDIKEANHNSLFKRNITKEELIIQFNSLKTEIDTILSNRNQQNLELVNIEEQALLDIFKQKIEIFYKLHKKFAKMAFSVTHFYNNLMNKVTNSKPDIGYGMSSTQNGYSSFSLKA